MSSDFRPFLIKDSRIQNITDMTTFGVYSGASQNTYQTFNATASSTSQISFNVNIPSENTILDRNVMIGATYKFTIAVTGGTTKAGESIMKYGYTDAFQAFPLNSSIASMNATINNTNVSINSADVLPILLKMIDQKALQKYQGTTATYIDSMGFTGAAKFQRPDPTTAGTYTSENSNPLGSIFTTTHDGILPRGCLPLSGITITNAKNANKLAFATDGDIGSVQITADLIEPLFLSPFLFGKKNEYNSAGFVGINTLNLNINVDTSLKRFWSRAYAFANADVVTTITLDSITNARLLLNFLTPHETDMVNAKNVIPFSDYPRYITGTTNSSEILANGGTNTIKSQNIQINQIPDAFIIALRKPLNTLTISDPNTFLPIRNISINFNNASGLLSSATQYNLWEMSRDNGVQQGWLEWSGRANSYIPTLDATTLTTTDPMMRLNAGSILVLNPAKDLSLPTYLSNGSLGQFNFQIDVTAFNYTSANITPELVVICVNSGIMTTIQGSSAVYTGLLSKQLVMDVVSRGGAIGASTINRLVGGGLDTNVAGAIKSNPVMAQAVSSSTGRGMSAGRKLDSFV